MGKTRTFARLDQFTRGRIIGQREAGAKREDFAKRVKKKDGFSPTLCSIDSVLAKKAACPSWHGEGSCAGGRPRALTTHQSKQVVDLVFAERGKAKVTTPYCRMNLHRSMVLASRWASGCKCFYVIRLCDHTGPERVLFMRRCGETLACVKYPMKRCSLFVAC